MLILFCVHDSKAQVYMPPVAFRSIGEASRAFEDSCRDVSSSFFKFPSDFTFIELGTFDQNTGKITLLENHKIIHNASEFSSQKD